MINKDETKNKVTKFNFTIECMSFYEFRMLMRSHLKIYICEYIDGGSIFILNLVLVLESSKGVLSEVLVKRI